MHGRVGIEAEVLWWREGDAWVGVFGGHDNPSRDAGGSERTGFEGELLLRATDWHVELSHAARGAFERKHIQAADADEAKARAADLLCTFRAKVEGATDSGRVGQPV